MSDVALSVADAFALAGRHLQAGRLREAEAIYRAVLKAQPNNASALHNLGLMALLAGQPESASVLIGQAVSLAPQEGYQANLGTALRRYLETSPEDEIGAEAQLAALGLATAPERASQAHMLRLYAERAETWPRNAGYRAPQLVADAIRDHVATPGTILDAGCGTGLSGPGLRPVASRLVGVDLSPAMLAVAARTGLYDELHAEDLIAHLEPRTGCYDAIASAATLIHFGDLGPVVRALSSALRPGGLLAFTAFPNEADADGYAVGGLDAGQGGVFFHGSRYIARVLADAGLSLVSMEHEAHESKNHKPFMGLVVLARR